jgi:hypothetical protein
MRYLRLELDKPPLEEPEQIMGRVGHAAQAIFDSGLYKLSDLPSHTVLGMCALILSSYRELAIQLGDSGQAYAAIERCFVLSYQAFIKNFCKPLLQAAGPSAQTLTDMNFRAWGKHMYPSGHAKGLGLHAFVWGIEESAYFHFFREHGEAGLAQIIHAADQAWIEASEAYDHAQFFQRRRTLTEDRDFCPFQFVSTVRKRAQAAPDLILELRVKTMAAQIDGDLFEIPSEAVRGDTLRERVEERSWAIAQDIDRRMAQ